MRRAALALVALAACASPAASKLDDARAALARGDRAAAHAAARAAVRAAPGDPAAQRVLAELAIAAELPGEALRALTALHELGEPVDTAALARRYLRRARARARLGHLERWRDLERAVTLDPALARELATERREAFLDAGLARWFAGDERGARAMFARQPAPRLDAELVLRELDRAPARALEELAARVRAARLAERGGDAVLAAADRVAGRTPSPAPARRRGAAALGGALETWADGALDSPLDHPEVAALVADPGALAERWQVVVVAVLGGTAPLADVTSLGPEARLLLAPSAVEPDVRAADAWARGAPGDAAEAIARGEPVMRVWGATLPRFAGPRVTHELLGAAVIDAPPSLVDWARAGAAPARAALPDARCGDATFHAAAQAYIDGAEEPTMRAADVATWCLLDGAADEALAFASAAVELDPSAARAVRIAIRAAILAGRAQLAHQLVIVGESWTRAPGFVALAAARDFVEVGEPVEALVEGRRALGLVDARWRPAALSSLVIATLAAGREADALAVVHAGLDGEPLESRDRWRRELTVNLRARGVALPTTLARALATERPTPGELAATQGSEGRAAASRRMPFDVGLALAAAHGALADGAPAAAIVILEHALAALPWALSLLELRLALEPPGSLVRARLTARLLLIGLAAPSLERRARALEAFAGVVAEDGLPTLSREALAAAAVYRTRRALTTW